MTATALLSRLEGVRKTGPDKWIACCPAHEDRSPSLSIREESDGKVLVHCFAECSALEIVNAVGLSLTDLFPHRIDHNIPRSRRRFDPMDVLHCTAHEVQIVACVASDIVNERGISLDDWTRVQLAAGRLWSAVEIANGR